MEFLFLGMACYLSGMYVLGRAIYWHREKQMAAGKAVKLRWEEEE